MMSRASCGLFLESKEHNGWGMGNGDEYKCGEVEEMEVEFVLSIIFS